MGGLAVLTAAVVGWLVRAAGAVGADPLTALVNRRGLDRLLDEARADAGQSGRPFRLAVIDVDDFKQVNDRTGLSVDDQPDGRAGSVPGLLPRPQPARTTAQSSCRQTSRQSG